MSAHPFRVKIAPKEGGLIMEQNKLPDFSHYSLESFSNKHLYLVHLGWERCKPNYQYTNYRDFYLLHFIKAGSGTLNVDGSIYKLSALDSFLIRPKQLAIYTADDETPWEYYYFAFNGELAKQLVERTYFKKGRFTRKMKDDSLAKLIVKAAYEMGKIDNPDIWGLEHLFKFLYPLMPSTINTSDSPEETADSSQIHLKRAQEYIQFNYYKPIQVEDICDALNISRSYLFRIFKKHTKSDVSDYLTSVRLQHAKHLLSTTEHSTNNISQLVGYLNPTSFYRMFKRMENVTPSEWRENHRKKITKNIDGSVHEISNDQSS